MYDQLRNRSNIYSNQLLYKLSHFLNESVQFWVEFNVVAVHFIPYRYRRFYIIKGKRSSERFYSVIHRDIQRVQRRNGDATNRSQTVFSIFNTFIYATLPLRIIYVLSVFILNSLRHTFQRISKLKLLPLSEY